MGVVRNAELSIQLFTQQVAKNAVEAVGRHFVRSDSKCCDVTKDQRYLAAVAIYSLNRLDGSANGIYGL